MRPTILTLLRYVMIMSVGFTQAWATSLYDAQNFKPLTSDNKALRVGDTLTVQIFENSSATASADTATRRNNELNASLLAPSTGNLSQAGLGVNGGFDGGGRTQRTNRLLATVSVTVQEVLPNGELRIAGEQLLTVNDEQQKVNLEGRVRPLDVSDGNIVLSTRISDARITYVGEGDVTERSKRGVWRQLLDWIGF